MLSLHFQFCTAKCLVSYKNTLRKNNFSQMAKLDFPFQTVSYECEITNSEMQVLFLL